MDNDMYSNIYVLYNIQIGPIVVVYVCPAVHTFQLYCPFAAAIAIFNWIELGYSSSDGTIKGQLKARRTSFMHMHINSLAQCMSLLLQDDIIYFRIYYTSILIGNYTGACGQLSLFWMRMYSWRLQLSVHANAHPLTRTMNKNWFIKQQQVQQNIIELKNRLVVFVSIVPFNYRIYVICKKTYTYVYVFAFSAYIFNWLVTKIITNNRNWTSSWWLKYKFVKCMWWISCEIIKNT